MGLSPVRDLRRLLERLLPFADGRQRIHLRAVREGALGGRRVLGLAAPGLLWRGLQRAAVGEGEHPRIAADGVHGGEMRGRVLVRLTGRGEGDARQLQVTFWQGVLLQFLNIKAWMLALTVVAGWLAGRADMASRFAVVLPIMLAFGLCSNLTYALIGTLLRRWLADAEHGGRRLRWFNRSMAAVLVATAAWLATF